MKLFINPKYQDLSTELSAVIAGEIQGIRIYKEDRNKVYSVSFDGTEMVVKQFKVPNMFNRVVYTFFRGSKARRSYEHAEKLISLGIGTAEPIAYAETHTYGLFHTGYYISASIDQHLIEELESLDAITREDIIRDFSRFTVELHKKNIFHKDYNIGNIFYRKTENGSYAFSLIDINRMRFRRPRKKDVVDSFTRMNFSRMTIVDISARYAEMRGWNADMLCGSILYEKGLNLRNRIKKTAKGIVRRLHL